MSKYNVNSETRLSFETGQNSTFKNKMRIFICYPHIDKALVIKPIIDAILPEVDCSIWYDDMLPAGVNWQSCIAEQVKSCDVMIVVVTKNTFSRDILLQEIRYCKSIDKPIIPIVFDIDEHTYHDLNMHIGPIQACTINEISKIIPTLRNLSLKYSPLSSDNATDISPSTDASSDTEDEDTIEQIINMHNDATTKIQHQSTRGEAIALFQEIVNSNVTDKRANSYIADSYYHLGINESNNEQAIALLRRAYELRSADAAHALAIKRNESSGNSYINEVKELFRFAARNSGSKPEYCFDYGKYLYDNRIKQEYTDAFRCMSCAAEASDYVVPANYYLGLFYQTGFGSISKDLVKALSCFQTAMKSMSSKYADAATRCYEKIASKLRFKASAAQIWAAIAGVLGVIELLDAFGIVDISDLLVNIFK